jgi:predicted nucleic-acid-binding Zn-ribbon protein
VSIKHSQFNAFLAAVAPEKACPECGVNEWTTVGQPEEGNALEATLPIVFSITEDSSSIAEYPLICANCGFTKKFSAPIVDAWISRHG